MKKLILMAVAATLTLNLVACTGETNNAKNSNLTPDSSQSENQEAPSIQTYMGQVSRKVGNDITLSIGKFIIDNKEGSNETFICDGNGETRPYDGDPDAEVGNTVIIAMPDDGSEEGDGNAEGGYDMEKLPIEFTGEVREFTIPAGVKIMNTASKEVTLDAVSKGSLVQLIVNESTGVVESLMVW